MNNCTPTLATPCIEFWHISFDSILMRTEKHKVFMNYDYFAYSPSLQFLLPLRHTHTCTHAQLPRAFTYPLSLPTYRAVEFL